MIREDHRQKPHECSRETSGKLVLAEYAHGNGVQPVVEGGLFEVLDIIQKGRYEVAPLQHFPGYLGVASFIGLDERNAAQGLEKDDAEESEEEQDVLFRRSFPVGKPLSYYAHFSRLMRSYCSAGKGTAIRTRLLG